MDLKNVEGFAGELALDSGAYRAWKGGRQVNIPDYLRLAESRDRKFSFRVAADVIADAEATMENWCRHFAGRGFVPVWGWGAPPVHLLRYLDEAPLVGIGGLVPLMRAKDEEMLECLENLCSRYPGRFHIFGINWLKAIEVLQGLAVSGDTSKWLDGGRYGHLIFVNTRTGRLSQAPAKVLGRADLTRAARCISSAQTLATYGGAACCGE